MKASLYFTTKNNIVWTGSGFETHFFDMDIKLPKKGTFFSKLLQRNMTDKEIQTELKPSELTLGEMAYILKNDSTVLTNGYANVFYIVGTDGTLWAVDAFWRGDGWRVSASSVGDRYRWGADDQVFSRDSFDFQPLETLGFFDPLKLEIIYGGVKYKLTKDL